MKKLISLCLMIVFCAECSEGRSSNAHGMEVKSIELIIDQIDQRKTKVKIEIYDNTSKKSIYGRIDLSNLAAHLYKQMHVIGEDVFGAEHEKEISFKDFCGKCINRLANHYITGDDKGKDNLIKYCNGVIDSCIAIPRLDWIEKLKNESDKYKIIRESVKNDLIYMFGKRKFSGWIWDKRESDVCVLNIEFFLKYIFEHMKKRSVILCGNGAYKITFPIPKGSKYKNVLQNTYLCSLQDDDNIRYKITKNINKKEICSVIIVINEENNTIMTMYPSPKII